MNGCEGCAEARRRFLSDMSRKGVDVSPGWVQTLADRAVCDEHVTTGDADA